MKAFLSHSSRDKQIVEQVAEVVGSGKFEMDSVTFDRGLLNVSAIQDALKRSSLFVLFLSRDALASNAVRYEVLHAQELLACGALEKFLVVCLDEEAFASANEQWKHYNFVRKSVSPQSIGRLILSQLLVIQAKDSASTQPFVGREQETREIKASLSKPELTHVRALYISGNAGIGRRTFAKRIFKDVFSAVNPLFPEIELEQLDGYYEIYRKLGRVITPFSTLAALRTRALAFDVADDEQRASLIAQLLNQLLEAREALIINDRGGLLDDAGRLQPHIKTIIAKVAAFPHPPIVFVAERMMPKMRRDQTDGVVFEALPSLTRDEMSQLLSFSLRLAKIRFTSDDLAQLVELGDGHPFNAHFMVEIIKDKTLSVFLADTSDFHQWKRRRGSEFLRRIEFTPEDVRMLVGLRDFRGLDFETLVGVAGSDAQHAGSALGRLMELHIVESSGDTYQISPPLVGAVERDRRLALSPETQHGILRTVGSALGAKRDEDEVSVSMVDAAILAKLQEGTELPETFAAFLLPSHLVWLARRRYDQGNYRDCIRLARSGLEAMSRLSVSGRVEACRYLCLAAARRNEDNHFQFGISILQRTSANDSYARSNVNFLLGFNAKLNGNLPEAEGYMRNAYDDSPGNFQAARELASICMIRGELESAEQFARRAFGIAPDNAYILDIMLSVLIKLPAARRGNVEAEVADLFERLKHAENQEDRSFYVTRRAEYEFKYGNLREACHLIDEAARKTPGIFQIHALRAEIYLEYGNKAVALEELQLMRKIVYRTSGTERLTNLRPLLEVEASYLLAIGEFAGAKEIYRQKNVFTDEEAEAAVRRIDYEQALRRP